MLRNVFWIAALVIALSAVTGCKKSADRSRSPDSDTPRKVLLFGNSSEPQDLDPQLATGVVEHHIITTLLEGLVTTDPQTQEPRPSTAERWDVSPDGLVYTFHLRADARWSNGDPVTAQDFLRSFQRILTPTLAAEYAYILFHVAGAEDYYRGRLADFSQTGFNAIDSKTLQLTLRHPTPFLLPILAFYPCLPVHIDTIARHGGLDRRGSSWTRVENYVGNGPFVLKEWRQNQRIVVARSPTYWDHANVKLDEIHFLPIESTDTEERMFRTGQLHITQEVPRSKIPVYQKEKPDSIRLDLLDGVYFYRFNVKHPPLDNPKVRRALALAIDRESLTRDVLGGGELPAYHVVPPGNAGFESRHKLNGDIAEARRILAEAGYPEGKGFPRVELLYNTLEKHRSVAEAVQQMWRKNLGVEITLRNEEWKVYLDSQDAGNFDLMRAGWIADYADPHVFLDIWETGGGNNDSNWGNPEYDRLLRSALFAKSITERYAIYQQMEKILVDELPLLPIFFYTQPYLISPKVKGYYVTPLDNYPWKHVDLLE